MTLTKHRPTTVLTALAMTTTALLTALAFAASYAALADWARRHGQPGWVHHVWPLFLDGFVLVGSLFVLRAALAGQRAWYPMSLVIAGSLGSVAFNVAHVATWAGRLTAAVPPVAALLAFELCARELYKALRDGPGPDRTEDESLVGADQADDAESHVGPGPDPERTVLAAEDAQALALEGWHAGRPAVEVARQIGRDASLVRRWYRRWDEQDGPAAVRTGPGTVDHINGTVRH